MRSFTWGKLVGRLGIIWAQQPVFYTKIRGQAVSQTNSRQSFTSFSRRFYQTLSPIFQHVSYLLMVAFYPSSTLSNNNNFSNKYLFSN
jgi:hypothetical protein